MRHIQNQTTTLIKRLGLVLIMFFIGRLFFLIHNIAYFKTAWPNEIFSSFFYGVQFDISAIIYFNLPFIIISLLPFTGLVEKISTIFSKIYFVVVNGSLYLINLLDAEYFKFTGTRTNSEIFGYIGVSRDILTLIPRFIYDYWFIILFWLITLMIILKIYPYSKIAVVNKKVFKRGRTLAIHVLIMLLVTTLLVSFARGYRLKPLRIIHAAQYVSARNIPLILNTPFVIMKTFNSHHLKVPQYFSDDNEALKYFNSEYSTTSESKYSDLNIVVIIMESFSTEFSEYITGTRGYMPFLDSLMTKSLTFPNSFANGKRSIEALPAILSSIPALSDTPFVTSPYSGNRINSVSEKLFNEGYHTSFFHGGINGTMAFDGFARMAGIEHYYGKTEFNNDNYFDGYWGIFDNQFFSFFAETANTFSKPFFSVLFSLSSHHPYVIPAGYEDKFDEGELQIHKTISYADYSLKNLFETLSGFDWYENTLFVITSDHTAQSKHPFYQNRIGDYMVPILFYHPGNSSLKGVDSRITQHIDIMPSVLEYAGIQTNFISFGKSVFDKKKEGFSINYLNGIYQYMERDWLLLFDGERSTALYNFQIDSLLTNNLIDESEKYLQNLIPLEKRTKSIIQQYNQRMVFNKLHLD